MKRLNNRRGAALILALTVMVNTILGLFSPSMNSYAYTERPAKVNASSLNVRSGPGTSNSIVGKLTQGAAVTVIGEKKASDGALWYQIRFTGTGGAQTTGYALNSFIKFQVAYTNDSDFEAFLNTEGFPESYKNGLRQLHAQYPSWVFRAQKTGLDWNTVIQNESIVPRNLVHKNSISSWKSTADGAYDWNSSTWPGFDGNSWVAASEDIIRYHMDPRNFLDEGNVFQFLVQSYDSSVQTKAGLETMIKGTYLAGTAAADTSGSSGTPGGGQAEGAGPGSKAVGPGMSNSGGTDSSGGNTSGSDVKLEGPSASITKKNKDVVTTGYGPGMSGSGPGASSGVGTSGSSGSSGAPLSGSTSYADILMNAGAQSGVNPYVLAAMIIQEQGTNGTGGSISGREAGYEGFYNFFNIEAYQSGSLSAVQRGLWYASQSGSYERPWNSVDRSILGGSVYYGNNYVKVGQDTFYLKKFNVQGNNLYKHQYMTNVQGAASEAVKMSKAYTAELKKTPLEFKIPVFEQMPETACAMPTGDGSPNNKLNGLGVSGFDLTPTFSKDTASYDLIVNPSVSNITVQATAADSNAVVSGAGNVQLANGNNDIAVKVKASNGTERVYNIRVVRQDNGQSGNGSSGSGPGGVSGPGGAAPQTPGSGNVVSPAETGVTGQGTVSGTVSMTGPGSGTSLGISPGTSPGSASQGNSSSTGSVTNPQTSPAGSRGDINGDGKRTVVDVVLLQKYVLGTEKATDSAFWAADINSDGKVDLKDILLLQRSILGLESIS